ncbi:MAG TPA: PAS domain-containing protein [Flavipsychrobacter sp.]|nr:PAS domain-containing protein [Flavipsychrobacter sp.]
MEETLLETTANQEKLIFTYLPAYAKFVREQHLIEYIRHQLKGAKELRTPLLRLFEGVPDEQIIEASIPDHEKFLAAAEQNRLKGLLDESMLRWVNDQLEVIGQNEIEAEDITQISYLRKTALLHFLPVYTSDIKTILGIVKEIDIYNLEGDTLATNTYIDLLRNRIDAHTKALKEREEQLLEAQKIAHLGSFSWDLTTPNLNISPQLMEILDLEQTGDFEYFINKVHPGDKEKVKAAMEEGYKTGNYECEYRLITNGGKCKTIWSRGIVSFTDGKPSHFRGTVMDVTEKQDIVHRLQNSESLYKQAQALSHIGNWTWDIATNKVVWSEELYRIFGLTDFTEEITFEKYLSYIHPQDKEMLLGYLQNSLKAGETYNFYHRVLLPDGTLKYIQSRGEVLIGADGKPTQLIGTGQDVTRQQLTERELRSSQEFIQKIADTTPSLISSYNVNTGAYTFINKAIESILGYEPGEVLAKGLEFFTEIIHPDDVASAMEKNARAVEEANAKDDKNDNEKTVEFKYRLRHKNGDYHWFHTFETVFDRNSEGKVEHLLNVSIDITEQELAEQSLQQKNIELQQSNASLEEYAYVASHDLKEPLRKIATFSDRLITTQGDELNENARLYLDKIIDSSRRMQSMISDLLSVSVISGNKSFEVKSLEDLLIDAKQTLEYKIEEKNARIISDGLPAMMVVPSQFRQLFLNLLTNSLKFAREGITPEIKITHQYLRPSQVARYDLTKAPRYLKIDFADNGIGFDNQFANKIFTIFQRLHGKMEYEGTGIGLAICRKVTENHGGTIIAQGTVNGGSTFTIIIPA